MPQTFPAGLPIGLMTWKTTEGSDRTPKEGEGKGVGIGVGAEGHNLDEHTLDSMTRQAIRRGAGQVAPLEEADGEKG